MIYTYGITQQGLYHKKNNTVCQDAHKIIKCNDSYVIAAVADGLGSEKYSDVASQMAVNIATDYCSKNIQVEHPDAALKVIKDSFALAQSQIEMYATEKEHDLDQYDTTLSLVIFDGENVYYGHSGDSGIIALTNDGLYKKVTEQQRDEDGRVYPLYFGEEKWVFGKFPDKVVSVMLATDGMLDIFFPIYIRNEPVDIYVALAQYFMNPESLSIDSLGEEYVERKISEFMDSISESKVSDDKTVVVLVNPDAHMTRQKDDYYGEPDWDSLIKKYEEEWKKAAYPHMYKDESSVEENNEDE